MTEAYANDRRFASSLPLILAHEGLWSDNAADPGGPTMKGVTLKTYSDYLGRTATKDELRHIPDADLQNIYFRNYWKAARCDVLPPGVDYMVFDLAVNSGVNRACRYLQRAVSAKEDAQIGPATLGAVAQRDASSIINRMSDFRRAFYKNLSTFPTFGKGWLARLVEVTATANQMAEH